MFDLVRLIYYSRASFNWSPDDVELRQEVVDILKEARRFNREARITGVLFFADGYFFQCLEGRRKRVLSLAEKIEKDPRHTDFKISFCRRARRRKFKDWSMKFVPVENVVLELIATRGYKEFKPDQFTESDINDLVQLFTKMSDTSLIRPELRQAHKSKPGFWERLFAGSAPRSV